LGTAYLLNLIKGLPYTPLYPYSNSKHSTTLLFSQVFMDICEMKVKET
jgi:hypothetical protein